MGLLNFHVRDWKGNDRVPPGRLTQHGLAVKFEYWDADGNLKLYQFQDLQIRNNLDGGTPVVPGVYQDVGETVGPLYELLQTATYARRRAIQSNSSEVTASGAISVAAPGGAYFSRAIINLPDLIGDAYGSGAFLRIKHSGFYAFGNTLAGMEPTRELHSTTGLYYPERGDANLLSVFVRDAQAVEIQSVFYAFPRVWLMDEEVLDFSEWRYNNQHYP